MKITQKQHDKETERNEKEEKTGYTFNVSFSTIKLWVKGQNEDRRGRFSNGT